MTDLAASQQKSESFYSINGWYVIGVISFIYLFFNWYLQSQVLTDDVYTYSLGSRISAEKLSSFLRGQHQVSVLSYIGSLIVVLMKMLLVSFCLYTGLVLISVKTSFKTLFRIVLFAESAFVAGILLRLLLLSFSHPVESLAQYMAFAPLSLYSLFTPAKVPTWLTYPLQTLDVFQAAYIFLLAVGLQYYLKLPFKKMLKLVLASYGIGLLACMIGFAFVSVSFNP